mgnify:CR=1 FL=1
MTPSQLRIYVLEGRRLYMTDTGFKITTIGVQFYPNETDNAIEDFFMPMIPGMNGPDVLVECDRMGTLIRKWREYNENNREYSVLGGDPTIN